MPTPLHKEIRWLREEIDLCKRMIKEVEGDPGGGPDKVKLLERLRETMQVHVETLAGLEGKLPGEG